MIIVSAESVFVGSFPSRFHFNCTFKERRIEFLFILHTAEICALPAITLSFGTESDPPALEHSPRKVSALSALTPPLSLL